VPLLDGPVTLNAVIYGALSGLALVILVLIGVTVSNVLDWSALLRLMPASLTGVAVAGSVAFLFLPQMARSYREIVDAHAVRGRQIHGLRDFATLGPALLSNGLDRAASMAALLESRSFGGAKRPDSRLRLHQASVAGGLASVCTTAYLISVNETDIAVIAGVSAGAFAVAAWRGLGQDDLPRTRFRQPDWSRDDSVIVLGAAVTMAGVLWSMRAHSGAIQYEPYPMLHAPFVGLPTLFSLLGLLAPAIVVSRSGGLTE